MAGTEQLIRVAYLYYERGLRQKEIADLMHLSRSTVSRLLQEARDRRIVEVHVPLTSSFSTIINWHQVADETPHETVTIHVMMLRHSFTESLVPLIPEFEKLTGIKVLYHISPQDAEYFAKLNTDLATGAGLIDVFMTGQYIDWQFVHPGWIEPLDDYLNDAALTDVEWYDPKDFFDLALGAHRWDGHSLGKGTYGTGQLHAIPVTYETMSMAYRTDLFEQAGLPVNADWPQSWHDILYAAKKLTLDRDGDGVVDQYGIISRGAAIWESMFGGYSNIFYSYGASDFDRAMKPGVDCDAGLEATNLWVEMIRCCASPRVPDLYWPQVKNMFAQGNAAMVIDCDWFAPAAFEKPGVSKVAGKLRYALTPPGPGGQRMQDTWFWSLAMNRASYHKVAAWLFIQWATSKPVMLHTTLEYENWNPPRRSVWEDPEVVAETRKWSNYRDVVEQNRRYGTVVHSVNPRLPVTHDIWWSNVRDAIMGRQSVKAALQATNQELLEVMAEMETGNAPTEPGSFSARSGVMVANDGLGV